MKPDIICCFPVDTFYPLFVHQMNRDRHLFDKLIVVMTPGNPKFDFTKEVRHYLDKALIITTDIQKLTAGGKDWRNVAVNLGYQRSRSDYVLHLEQDFLFGDTFMEDLLLKGVDYDLVSENEGGRLHPCCMLVKTSPARMTSMDFSAYPPVGDHFKKFTDDEANMYSKITEEATKEINGKYEQELKQIKDKLALRDKDAVNATVKKELKNQLKEIEKKIEIGIKAKVKEKSDYEIPMAEVKKAGISTTGAEIENELIPLNAEFKKYSTTGKLWSSKIDSITYDITDDEKLMRLSLIKETEEIYGQDKFNK